MRVYSFQPRIQPSIKTCSGKHNTETPSISLYISHPDDTRDLVD